MKVLPKFQIIIILIIFFQVSGQSAALTINFAVPASGEGLKKLLIWTPIIKQLEDSTGQDINLIIARDHEIIKKELEQKNYDFAVLDPFWYEHWKNKNICSLFLKSTLMESTEIRSILIVNKNSIFRSVNDLKDSNIALTVPNDSAYGFYIPLALMYESGIDPFSLFKSIVFPETFESILKGVAYGKLDSGFITSDILTNAKNSPYRNNIRIIIESEPLPPPLIVIRNDFNRELSIAIKQTLILISNKKEDPNNQIKSDTSHFEEPISDKFIILTNYLNILEKNNASPE